MKKYCCSIGMPIGRSIIAAIACLCIAAMFCGCSASADDNNAEIPFYPVVVYDDGVYAVECTDLIVKDRGDGKAETFLCLRVTNNSTDSMAVSSVLGIRFSADGARCQMLMIPADKTPLDGLVDVGDSRVGWIAIATPVEASSFTAEMAVDYLDDQWISFTISQ